MTMTPAQTDSAEDLSASDRDRVEQAFAALADAHVRHFLDLSTAHLPRKLMDDLSGLENVVAYPNQWGAFMWVPDDPQGSNDEMEEVVPEEVLRIQLYARSLGCDYVLFDADGPVNPALPTWEWA